MSPFVPGPRAAGVSAALLLAFGVFFTGCNRSAPPATALNTPAPPAGGAKNEPTADAKAGAAKDAKSGPATAAVAAEAAAKKKAADAEKEKARQAAAEMVPVETALVMRGTISAFLAFNSTLETESMVDIYPQTGGQVEALLVEEGKVVQEGDPLLKIEDRELKLDVDESEANFDYLKKSYVRNEDLFRRNLINKQEFETLAYQFEQARLKLERSKIRLSYATVRAPFAGVISAREVQVGARVGTGTKIFSMVKLDDIVARVFIPGRYLPVVADQQPAIVTSEFLPDRSFQGWVKRISPVIDPKSGTFKVTVGVRGDKPTDLPPGLFVGVRIITDTRPNAVLIPKRAVVYEGGERYVFVVDQNRATKKKLTVGYEDPQNVEARSGIDVGSAVIVLGHSGLKDGALVRSVNAPPPTPPADAAKADPPKAPAPKAEKS